MTTYLRPTLALALLVLPAAVRAQSPEPFSFDKAQGFFGTYCRSCHQGNKPQGGFHVDQVASPESFLKESKHWASIITRVHNGEMPPKGAPSPDLDVREPFVLWADSALRKAACGGGPTWP